MESEEKYRRVIETANEAIFVVQEGMLQLVNDRLVGITGYSREELERMTVNDITYPEDMNISPMFFKSAVSGKCENRVFEKRYLHKQGHVILGRVSISLVRDSKSNPLHFVIQVEDITESKRAEMQLREDKRKLRSLALELTAVDNI